MALSTSLSVVTRSGLSSHNDYLLRDVLSVGVATFSNFKTGSSNLHSAGVEVAGVNVLGGDTPIGAGATIYDDGGVRFSGVVTASSFHGSVLGDISQATGAAAGLGTALSQTQTDPLNKIYYTDKVLSISTTTTIDHPATANLAYTQYGDIKIENGHDLIIKTDDDFKYDILGISTTKIFDIVGNVTGNVTGNLTGNVTGSGANLTNIPAGQLTGALPAISGANLTGIPIIPPLFRVIRSDYHVLANNTDTVISFDNDSSGSSVDTNNFYNTSTYRFTPTIAGYYQLTAQLEFSLNSGNNLFGVMIFKNGAEALRVRRWNDGSNSNVNINVTGIVAFNGSSDYAQAYGWQNSGGNISIIQGSGRTFFEGHYIRPL